MSWTPLFLNLTSKWCWQVPLWSPPTACLTGSDTVAPAKSLQGPFPVPCVLEAPFSAGDSGHCSVQQVQGSGGKPGPSPGPRVPEQVDCLYGGGLCRRSSSWGGRSLVRDHGTRGASASQPPHPWGAGKSGLQFPGLLRGGKTGITWSVGNTIRQKKVSAS